jgi:hypothetical protein
MRFGADPAGPADDATVNRRILAMLPSLSPPSTPKDHRSKEGTKLTRGSPIEKIFDRC